MADLVFGVLDHVIKVDTFDRVLLLGWKGK